jgi:hypothetical protein
MAKDARLGVAQVRTQPGQVGGTTTAAAFELNLLSAVASDWLSESGPDGSRPDDDQDAAASDQEAAVDDRVGQQGGRQPGASGSGPDDESGSGSEDGGGGDAGPSARVWRTMSAWPTPGSMASSQVVATK